MYSLCGFSQNIKNVYRLAAPYRSNQTVKHTDDLLVPYLDFLKTYQQDFPHNCSENKIIMDINTIDSLRKAFSASKINDLNQEQMIGQSFNSEEQLDRVMKVSEALDSLKQINRELWELFQLCIHSILITGSGKNSSGLKAHGGTSNKCIGLMWLTVAPSLSKQDIIEMLIHELTHTLIFLDELNHPQFIYTDIAREKTWGKSAILHRLRPMDKVLHSIVVSTEILLARDRFLPSVDTLRVHPESTSLRVNTLEAIESILTHPIRDQVCLPRAIELADKCKQTLLNLDLNLDLNSNSNLNPTKHQTHGAENEQLLQ